MEYRVSVWETVDGGGVKRHVGLSLIDDPDIIFRGCEGLLEHFGQGGLAEGDVLIIKKKGE